MRLAILIAGHGGQGVLELGNYVAYHGMLGGQHVAYAPSYGPETRGGKVRCYCTVSDEEIDTPVPDRVDVLLVMNRPSMAYLQALSPRGLLIMNSSLIPDDVERSDVVVMRVPGSILAEGLRSHPDASGVRDPKLVTNSVFFGAYLAATGQPLTSVGEVLEHFLTGKKARTIRLNDLAVHVGHRYARENFQPWGMRGYSTSVSPCGPQPYPGPPV